MKTLKKRKRTILILSFVALALIPFAINKYINHYSKTYIFENKEKAPSCYTGLVLGAFVRENGYPSRVLRDRLDMSIDLYNKGKIKRILLSGDHGKTNYDEVNSMKIYLIKKGVPSNDVFMDHAGFDTYSSVVRAKEVFLVEDVLIVTQRFHLARAVYIARKKGLSAYGIVADDWKYASLPYLKKREIFAKVKAYWEVLINKSPKYLGDEIPITGDNTKTLD